MSKRYERALEALKSDSMPIVLNTVIRSFIADKVTIKESDELDGWDFSDQTPRTRSLLKALRDSYTDALAVMMYVGRDLYGEDVGHIPYTEDELNKTFDLMWNLLSLDTRSDGYSSREMLCSKMYPVEHLIRAAFMFGIDMYKVVYEV